MRFPLMVKNACASFTQVLDDVIVCFYKINGIYQTLNMLEQYDMRTHTLREKCPNTLFSLVRIFLYSVQIQENTDQKKLRIWTLFTQ